MNIALFGATGGTGHQVLLQALEQGHRVKALARDPAKLPAGHDGLIPIVGDVLDQAAVSDCVHGTDAVICVLGTRPGSQPAKPDGTHTPLGELRGLFGTKAEPIEARGTRSILAAMQSAGVRRLIAVTSMGVGDSADQMPFIFRAFMQMTLKSVMAAKEEQERLIRESGLDWTIVRPGGLTDGPRTGTYAAGIEKSIKARQVSRADVAEFVLRQLTDARFIRQTPAIS
jgi:putative NADH-flavin reductase